MIFIGRYGFQASSTNSSFPRAALPLILPQIPGWVPRVFLQIFQKWQQLYYKNSQDGLPSTLRFQHPIKQMGKHGIFQVPFLAPVFLLRQRGWCRTTLSGTNPSQLSQPKSICFRDIVEVTAQDIILWGHREEILLGVLNSCFSMNHDIYCVSSLYWLLEILQPKLQTTFSKYKELHPGYILLFLLLTQILSNMPIFLLKCTYLHMLVDIYFACAYLEMSF